MKIAGRFHYGWIVVIGAFLSYLCWGISRNLYPFLVPSIEADLNLSHEPMGVIASSYFFAYTIMTFVWGIIADKIGPRRCMLSGMVIIAIGLTCMGFMSSATTGALFYFFCGVGAAGISVPVVPLVSRWFSGTRRGLAFGMIIAGNGTVLGILGLVVPVILSNYSWRWSWWISAAFVITVAVIARFVLADDPRKRGLAPVGTNSGGISVLGGEIKTEPVPVEHRLTIFTILRRGTVWNLAGIFFTWAFSYAIFMTFAVAYLEEIGWAPRAAAGALATWGAIAIPAPIIWGFIADRVAKKYLLMAALLLQAAGLFVFLSGGTAGGYLGAAIIGFGSIAIPLLMKASMADYCEPVIIGTTFGLITLFFGVGSIIAPALGGLIADATGALRTAILVGFGSLASSFVLSLILRKPPKLRL